MHRALGWYQAGYKLWVSFSVHRDKISVSRGKIVAVYETTISRDERMRRIAVGRPVAHAIAYPDGDENHYSFLLLATPAAVQQPDESLWRREYWRTSPLEIGSFILDTHRVGALPQWEVKPAEYALARQRLLDFVRSGDVSSVAAFSRELLDDWPAAQSIQRQIVSMVRQAAKMWEKVHRSSWPGPAVKRDAESFFRNARKV